MSPWQVSFGLSLAFLVPLGVAVVYELQYLNGYWTIVWEHYAYHLFMVVMCIVLAVVSGIYQIARTLVMGDVGSRVSVMDKTIREGRAGDPELSRALSREETGEYES